MDMDLEAVRRKRIKLFDPQNRDNPNTPFQDPGPSQIYTKPTMDSQNVDDDEAFARQLAADLERSEQTAKAAQHSIEADEQFARGLGGGQYVALPGAFEAGGVLSSLGVQISDDARYARELAAQLEEEGQNGATSSMDAPAFSADDAEYARKLQAELDQEEDSDDIQDYLDSARPRKKKRAASSSRKYEMQAITATDVDESDDAQATRLFATSVCSLKCKDCHSSQDINPDMLLNLYEINFGQQSNGDVRFVYFCESCNTQLCIGCGALLDARSNQYGASSQNRHFIWHCDRDRLSLIWLLLCGYDNRVKHNKPCTALPKQLKEATKPPTKRFLPIGIGYGSRSSVAGIGYGDDYSGNGYVTGNDDDVTEFEDDGDEEDYDERYRRSKLHKRSKKPFTLPQRSHKVDPDDEITARTVEALAALLPSPSDHLVPTEFDYEPPSTLASLLFRSSILDKAAALLRNDSLEDATRQFRVYNALLAFIRTASKGGDHVRLIIHAERTFNKAGHDLLKVSAGVPTRLKDESRETSSPLGQCIVNLTNQSAMVLKSAQANSTEFQTEDAQEMLLLCTSILECGEICRSDDKPDSNGQAQRVVFGRANHDWQKDIAVLEVSDEVILESHYFAKEARKFTNPPVGRMRHLIKEISILQTGLPPNVFIRYGESRLDVMKALIVGPQGTPYENGLFEFDIICGMDYPNVAPAVQFKTTGGGRVGFNPNLYNTGKVCLSLLGTWSGEKWRPGKSTLLQVLVSIQSMIFNDEPHCNEPGHEGERGSEQSKSYNRRLYPDVVKFGMIEWLEGKRSIMAPSTSRGAGSPGGHTPMPGAAVVGEVPPGFNSFSSTDMDGVPNGHAFVPMTTGGVMLGHPAHPSVPSIDDPMPAEILAAMFGGQQVEVGKSKDGKDNDIWKDVAKKHFEVCKKDIVKTVGEWIKDKAPAPAPSSKKKGKQGAGFMGGTGWGGRTLGDGTENAARSSTHSFNDDVDLVSKLKGALAPLEQNRGHSFAAWMGGE